MRKTFTHKSGLQQSTFAEPWQRVFLLIVFSTVGFLIIVGRLFYLQVLRYDYYQNKAVAAHSGESPLLARRGEIFVKDYASGENIRVATNITLDTLIVDPSMVKDANIVAERLVPLLFNEEKAKKADQERIEAALKLAKTEEEKKSIKAKTKEELYDEYYKNILNSINRKIIERVSIGYDLDSETLTTIKNLQLPGIEVTGTNVYSHTSEISNEERPHIAEKLAPYLGANVKELGQFMKGINAYSPLESKLSPDISAKIREIIAEDKLKKKQDRYFNCLRLEPHYYRFYPEASLAANILGFLDNDGNPNYGIENSLNSYLQGKNGVFKSQMDSSGRQITVGDVVIKAAEDGSNVVLTIDRSLQAKVESMLARAVKNFRADNGQVIIMDPKTGKIMVMASYPTFNPNVYPEAAEKETVNLTEEEIQRLKPDKYTKSAYILKPKYPTEGPAILIFKEKSPDGKDIYRRYKNLFGDQAYQNKPVSQMYDPGSVFKPLTMASAIDDGDVTPNLTINDPGVRYYDPNPGRKRYLNPADGKYYDAKIDNVDTVGCRGRVSMADILKNSCNTGISWVAHKMGRSLFYSYILKFGFNERTDIEFADEAKGLVTNPDTDPSTWTDAGLATHAFGQGLRVTPLQMIAAYGAIANGGVLMQPYIVDRIEQKGSSTVTEPKAIRRVISEETAEIIKNMLVNNVENGKSYLGTIRLKDHYVGAKTGTAQTYDDETGKPRDDVGTTITNVLGFAPVNDPQFVVMVKMDYPRTTKWADATSGVLMKEIFTYLFEYFNIPPDKGR